MKKIQGSTKIAIHEVVARPSRLDRIYERDCISGMRSLPDKSIDMILTDLPYQQTQNSWDTLIPFDVLWEQYERIIKDDGAIVLTASQPFTSMLVMSNPRMFRYSLVWKKNKFSNFLDAGRKPMKQHEDILVFYRKRCTYNPQYTYGDTYTRWNSQEAVDRQTNYGRHKASTSQSLDGRRLPISVLDFPRVERPDHPTQKPVELFEYLIKTYSNEGDVVLDSCMGSGTTAVACLNTERHFIGFETSKEYCLLARERVRKQRKRLIEMGECPQDAA